MAKNGSGKAAAPKAPAADPTVVGVEADGMVSAKFYLSDDTEVIVLATGGKSYRETGVIRDRLVEAVQRTITAAAVPPAAPRA